MHRRSDQNTEKIIYCLKTPLDRDDLEVTCQSQTIFQKPSLGRCQMSLHFLENMHCNRVNTHFPLTLFCFS